MPNSKKQRWTPPEVTSFANADEAWAHYKSKCGPEELVELKAALEPFARKAEGRAAALRRRA